MSPSERGNPRHKFYSRDNARIATDTSEVTTKVIVGDNESEGRYTILSDIWKVGFSVPTHFHARDFEAFILLSGDAEWTVKGETHRMRAVDAVYIPANAPHSARTLGSGPTHFILVYSSEVYEAHLEREASYTEEQQNDPRGKETPRKLNDFNVTF